MPNCIIMGCPHKTGSTQKFPGIVLHSFPSSIERIKKWLLQTGQVFQDSDALANKIFEGKKTDTFRMCSAHFTKDSYIFTAHKRFLRHNALPAIFPQAAEGKPLIDEQKIVGKKRRKSERPEAKNISCFICSRCLMAENIYEGKVLVDAATQTENNLLSPPAPVLPMTQALLMLSLPLQSYAMQPVTPTMGQPVTPTMGQPVTPTMGQPVTPAMGHQVTPAMGHQVTPTMGQSIATLGGHSIVSLNTVATSSQMFPHPLVERDGLPISMCSDHVLDRPPESEVSMSVQSQELRESNTIQKVVRGRKLLVFEDCLDSLVSMVMCRGSSGCNKLVRRFNKEYRGSAVIIRGQCENGHFFKIWESQPKLKGCFAGNILLSASLFCSGLQYQEADDFFKALGLRHISEKKCRHYQKFYCYPAILEAWEKEHKEVTQELQGRPVSLSGDGQYRTSGSVLYTLSDTITDKIVDLEIIGRSQCRPSVDMQRHGLEVCMSRAIEEGLDVACLASERHEGLVEAMKEHFGHVEHQFNVWRYANDLLKKLRAASRMRFCAIIRPWIRIIYEHFLWSVQTCDNNEQLLREKWLSVLHHISDQHMWDEGRHYKQCAHRDLSQDTETLWLQPGSPAFQKVQEIVSDPQLMEDLKHLTWNCHSAISNVFHRKLLKFTTKRPPPAKDEMESRTKLAALNHNQNVARRKVEVRKITARRSMAGKEKRKWLVRPVHHPMSSDYLWSVMEGVLEICEGTKPTWQGSNTLSSITMTDRPHKDLAEPFSRCGFTV